MKRDYVSTLLLSIYLLMPPTKLAVDHLRINFSAPLSKWVEVRRFNSTSECENALENYRQNPPGGLSAVLESRQRALAAMKVAKCVSSHDPRLNGLKP
jgi:hypothetical protein